MRDLLNELILVFQDVFEDEELIVAHDTTAADVPGWDSLQHVSLVLKVEKCFGFRFTSAEVSDLRCVGDMLDIIASRTGKV
ncbi:acyl carrier protein [Paucibacter sp. Y2R2-4]|uniref:acyl carrier protein n=1 Tax=Paucibacter sp. Y2R2-4 TaxID=2893553 RepID=UPI0021E36DAC|nr:acyl carrier protein [Paucibacter sp. Y2R2-4]MCV2349761.1 acyl carrier protein [Paucibacter sp. Y2R2-4]